MADGSEWVDTIAIQQVLYRYFDAVNRGDLEGMRSVYADDAVWEVPAMGLRHESADAFIEFFRQTTAPHQMLVIMPHCPVIRLLDADTASATTTFHEIACSPTTEDGPLGPAGTAVQLDHYGIYDDDLARIDGEWKFTHRRAVSLAAGRSAAATAVMAERASLQHVGQR